MITLILINLLILIDQVVENKSVFSETKSNVFESSINLINKTFKLLPFT